MEERIRRTTKKTRKASELENKDDDGRANWIKTTNEDEEGGTN